MSKWIISPLYSATTAWWVTFTADTHVSFYRIFGYTHGKTGVVVAPQVLSFSNIANDDGTTATLYCGYQNCLGDFMEFPRDGILMKADQNAFVTLTWATNQTGRLCVSYEAVYK